MLASLAWLRGIQYYIHPKLSTVKVLKRVFESGNTQSKTVEDGLSPTTLVHFNENEQVTVENLQQKIRGFLAADDVFSYAFLEDIFIATQPHHGALVIEKSAKDLFASWNTKRVVAIDGSTPNLPPSGPYFSGSTGLRQVYRCYSDTYGAFVTPIVPSASAADIFEAPPLACVPVPSRLYFEAPSAHRPLSGLRVAVKDVIDIRGVRTSNCCRAYEALYPPQARTAPCLQMLLDLGATVVGKTKTVQFASGAHPIDFFDVQCSFNPGGDGYQSPSMSSVGSAAAMAGYDWLDFAIGTDTFGSVTFPASATGLFSLRPTFGIQDLNGVIPVSGQLDTVGFFTRTIELACRVSKAWLGSKVPTGPDARPTRLLWPKELFPLGNEVIEQAIETFVCRLEDFMKVKSIPIDLKDTWEKSGRGHGRSLEQYLHNTIAHIQLYDCYHNAAAFRNSYEAKFGTRPFVDPVIACKWGFGERLTREDYQTAVKEMKVFDEFMLEDVMPTESRSLLVLPVGVDSPVYRDQYFATAQESASEVQGFGFSSLVFPSLVGMPTLKACSPFLTLFFHVFTALALLAARFSSVGTSDDSAVTVFSKLQISPASTKLTMHVSDLRGVEFIGIFVISAAQPQ